MPKPIHHSDRYVPALDGLRTIAVALVLLYHLAVPGFSGGLLGVAVFFTLSGYLITTNLVRSKLDHGSFRLKTFWFRRFRRLLPAVITTLIVVLFLTIAFDAANLKERFFEALSALFYVNNWHIITSGSSYFDNFSGLGPLDHMWSLSIEEQFYLIWPLLLVALFAIFRNSRFIVLATIVLTAGSFALMWILASGAGDHTRIYEGTDTRAGGLLLGAALAIALGFRRNRNQSAALPRPIAFLLGLIGLAGIFALSATVNDKSIFLYRGGLLLLTVCTVLVVMAVLQPAGMWAKILGWTPLRWIGERSYGIYLWHLPLIAFLPPQWLPKTAPNPWVGYLTSVVVAIISVILAAVSWRVLEDPIRRHGIVEPLKAWWAARKSEEKPQRNYMGAIPATATVTVLGLILIGAPTMIGGGLNATASQGAAPKMELEGGTKPKAISEGNKPVDINATAMNCTTVIHVGDSTSLGVFDPAQLPEGAYTGADEYLSKGADQVIESVFGARATTQGYESYPSAVVSVQELLNQGQDPGTCWVIATGVNDAANYAALPDYGYEQNPDEIRANIRSMLNMLTDQKVMWNTVATYMPGNSYYDNENMKFFNKILLEVVKDYPNVAVWDWASEVEKHPEWFIPGDGTHYLPEGNAERAKRFAGALANAFPEGQDGIEPAHRMVTS